MKSRFALTTFSLVTLLLSSLSVTEAHSAKKEKCNQVGATKEIDSKEYICSFSGSKLVWKKAAKSKKVTQPAPTTFEELIGHKSIPTVSWSSYSNKIKQTTIAEVAYDIRVGPQTTLLNPNVKEVFENTTKVFNGFAQPKSILTYYYAFEDVSWAENELKNLKLPEYKIKEVGFTCNKSACRGATAGALNLENGNGLDYDNALIIFGVPGKNEPKFTYHLGGGIEAHEFAHTVQAIQFKNSKVQMYRSLPNWFVEGHAHLIGNISSAQSLSDYEIRRKFWFYDSTSVINEETINGMYREMAPNQNLGIAGGGNYYFQFVYTFGYLTVELLAALRGIDSPMKLMQEVAGGKTFDEAFKIIYGQEWSYAAPILAKAVVSQYSL